MLIKSEAGAIYILEAFHELRLSEGDPCCVEAVDWKGPFTAALTPMQPREMAEKQLERVVSQYNREDGRPYLDLKPRLTGR